MRGEWARKSRTYAQAFAWETDNGTQEKEAKQQRYHRKRRREADRPDDGSGADAGNFADINPAEAQNFADIKPAGARASPTSTGDK